MASPSATTTLQAGLKRACLSFWEVVAQSVANIAPTAAPALIVPFVFADAGNGAWLAFVIATIAMVLVALQVNVFARRSASPGALYIFVQQGMGASWGVLSGWALIIAYIFTGAAVLAGAANYGLVLSHVMPHFVGDWGLAIFFLLLTAALTGWIAYKDIKLSTRSMLIMEFSTVALILFVAAIYFVRHGAIFDFDQLKLIGVTGAGVRRGLVLSVFAYVGFESATALGHEARDPLHVIPASVLLSVLATAAFFIFMSYTLVMAFHGQPGGLNNSNAPLNVLAQVAGIPAFGEVIAVGAYVSFFACTLASINAAARVIFSMARHGLLPAGAGRAHATHGTPHVAVIISALLVLGMPLVLFFLGSSLLDIYNYLATIATFGFLVAYIFISIAAPLELRREKTLSIGALLLALISIVLLMIPAVGSIYPLPPAPMSYLPFIFVGLLAVGTAWFVYLRAFQPERFRAVTRDSPEP